jgi:hypothetical protein
MFSLQIGQDRLGSRSSSVPERLSWSRDWELPEWVRRGLRLGDLLCEGVGGASSPKTRRVRGWGFGSITGEGNSFLGEGIVVIDAVAEADDPGR